MKKIVEGVQIAAPWPRQAKHSGELSGALSQRIETTAVHSVNLLCNRSAHMCPSRLDRMAGDENPRNAITFFFMATCERGLWLCGFPLMNLTKWMRQDKLSR